MSTILQTAKILHRGLKLLGSSLKDKDHPEGEGLTFYYHNHYERIKYDQFGYFNLTQKKQNKNIQR